MKVILISKVVRHGNIGDIIDVKDGYARNFLIPTSKAIHYTKANYQVFEDQKKNFEAKNQEAIKNANEAKKLISGKDIVIIENASDDGRLYGAVNSGTISLKINAIDKTLKVVKSDITLEKTIKETGVYDVIVTLYADVEAKLRLIVSRNESEIDSVIKKSKEKAAQAREQNEEATKVDKKEETVEAADVDADKTEDTDVKEDAKVEESTKAEESQAAAN